MSSATPPGTRIARDETRVSRFFAETPIPELYRWFAEETRATSPLWEAVSFWIAREPTLERLLDALPGEARQPNRFLAALRFHDAPLQPGETLRDWVVEHWAQLRATIISRPTQTNEPGRLAVLGPILASLPQPLALLELGASAGLCLLPDRLPLRPVDATGTPPADGRRLSVAARLGVDRNPLDITRDDTRRWLRALVWPGEEDRERRLAHALEVAAQDPPEVVRGDLLEHPEALVGSLVEDLRTRAPEATCVVMHSVTLGYLPRAARAEVIAAIAGTGARWLAFEDARVLPEVAALAGVAPEWGKFVAALDGAPLAWSQAHGRRVRWLSP